MFKDILYGYKQQILSTCTLVYRENVTFQRRLKSFIMFCSIEFGIYFSNTAII